MKNVSIVSGYFNPIHGGHINLFYDAKRYGLYLVVIINNDQQQLIKKGKIIIEQSEREQIVKSLKPVDFTCISIDTDKTVCKTLEYIRQLHMNDELVFCNGGDRTSDNIPEIEVCKRLNIELKFEVGGKKINSSSDILRKENL